MSNFFYAKKQSNYEDGEIYLLVDSKNFIVGIKIEAEFEEMRKARLLQFS